VKRIHVTLHKALKQAVRWQMIPRNPCDAVDPPKGHRAEIIPLEKDQVRALLDTAERKQPRLYALYVLGVTTGMRQGELIGLQWNDLDLGAGRLTVKRSVFKGKIGTPKTARGSRTVRLTRLAVDALTRHKNQHKTSESWVFSTRNGTPLDCGNLHRDHWQRLLDEAGLPRVSFHAGTRHTCATLLLGQGVHPKLVADLLGHASIKTTLNIYSSVMPSMQDGVADAIEDALGGEDSRQLRAL
jgi:integrase